MCTSILALAPRALIKLIFIVIFESRCGGARIARDVPPQVVPPAVGGGAIRGGCYTLSYLGSRVLYALAGVRG